MEKKKSVPIVKTARATQLHLRVDPLSACHTPHCSSVSPLPVLMPSPPQALLVITVLSEPLHTGSPEDSGQQKVLLTQPVAVTSAIVSVGRWRQTVAPTCGVAEA
jgi:hypothetical protein